MGGRGVAERVLVGKVQVEGGVRVVMVAVMVARSRGCGFGRDGAVCSESWLFGFAELAVLERA